MIQRMIKITKIGSDLQTATNKKLSKTKYDLNSYIYNQNNNLDNDLRYKSYCIKVSKPICV